MGRLTPKDWENQSNEIWLKLGYIQMSDEPFRTFLSESLQKLAHYEDLEEQGGLIELPCAVGDTVWRIIEMSTGKTLNRNGATVNATIKRFIKPVKVTKNNLLDICETYGKKVFSTKEEAEAKLAELKGE